MTGTNLDDMPFLMKVANTIRGLSMDAVEKARSGHPGAPLGLADFAAVLSTRFLKVCPSHPDWPDRDRLVLSAGHASMLLYSILHLMGFDLPLSEIRNFRQWGSLTPGHPESHLTPGVETTTGPLGQGISNAVGMALAERMLAARFNREDRALVDHVTWVIASDGDMMEGVQSEAASVAGHLGLSRLVVYYDSNRITIDGPTDITFSEDVGRRYEAYGWKVLEVDGHDHEQIEDALTLAKQSEDRPVLVVGRSHIAWGSPGKQDSSSSHGAPLGADELRATKENLGWPLEPEFLVPDDVTEFFARRREILEEEVVWWEGKLAALREEDPDLAGEWDRHAAGEVPTLELPEFEVGTSLATRKASHQVLNALAGEVPFLVGGSADLAGSNKTDIQGDRDVSREDFSGRILRFGIREHAMGAIANGIALHGGLRPFAATFLVFSDYMRPPIRLAALMGLPVIYVFTHDSIMVGEDGPTHQPVEHLAALRSIPGLAVVRPADATETAAAWEVALRRQDGPTALVLTRQGLPVLERDWPPDVARGGYVALDADGEPDLLLLATGSEVHLAFEAARTLRSEGVKARVVSLPSFELFEAQDESYRESVIPSRCARRVGVEAAVRQGWDRYLGSEGRFVGIERFGASAPAKENAKRFGLTAENVLATARESLS
ncbi:MAG: transketolase [Planctomycetota bacterium]|jgi:transketolase